jgi:acyl carrier protein
LSSADTIRKIWCEVLGAEQFPADRSFFEAGGDSLLATMAADEISRELAVPLSVHDVYGHPTIEELCAHIDSLVAEAPAP